MKIRIGTRGSKLALWQAHHVRDRLIEAGAEVEIEVLVTRGDRIDDVPLQTLEGKAFFTKEIEDALLADRVDIAVHSHKDLPVESPPGLTIAAVPKRANPAERLLIAEAAHDPEGGLLPLKQGARVGTSSPRRQAQMAALRPDIELLDLRGNVPTRVERLREGRYDAILLAAAGLDRLELDTSDLVALDLSTEFCVPAPGQGALAIQVRENDESTLRFIRDVLHDEQTARVVRAERDLLTRAGGGCNLALGVSLEQSGEQWRARVFRGPDGTDPKREPRWSNALGEDPEAAVDLAYRSLATKGGTACGPLAGLRISIAGSSKENSRLGSRLIALGGRVIHEAVVETEDLGQAELDRALSTLVSGDAIAVTSRRAAPCLANREIPEGVLVAAVGESTASALKEHGVRAEFVGQAGGEELGQALPVEKGACVVHPCAVDTLKTLAEVLDAREIKVKSVPIYRTRAIEGVELDPDVDFRIFMSPSSVRAALAWEQANASSGVMRIALGASTSRALEGAGLSAFAPADGDHENIVRFLADYRTQGAPR